MPDDPPAGRSAVRLPADVRVLVGTAFTVAVGYGLVAPVLPIFARSFDVGLTATSTVIGAFAVVRVVFAPLSGRLVSRLGALPVLCAGLLIVAASSAACAVAGAFWQLLVFRAAGGVGSTFFTVSSELILIRASPRAVLGRASAAWAGGFLLGSVAGPAIGSALVPWGPRAPFLVYGGLLVVATVVAVTFLGGRTRAAVAVGHTPRGAVTFREACRLRPFRAALAANFLDGWTVHGIRVVLVPVFVTEVLGRTTSWSGVALTVFAAGTAAGLPAGGRLADRAGRRVPSMIGSATVAVTAVGLGLSSSLVVFLVVSLVSGIGTGLITPPANAAVGDVISGRGTDGRAGSALAGFQMVGDAGAVIGPLLVGTVADLGGYAVAFGTGAVVACVALVAWLRAPETRSP